ncbi:hypothetical protein L1987_02276 [Smallanthus sonchifolius]|uniref:Uncharacterized protein n=1 Tax=Smallanthus sonchifolius TaxID=185202 RepID=A0ACB9K7B9_9ASTR|nr:hypothetical protein L1987_02276 [Smallanthus sonchifolius]
MAVEVDEVEGSGLMGILGEGLVLVDVKGNGIDPLIIGNGTVEMPSSVEEDDPLMRSRDASVEKKVAIADFSKDSSTGTSDEMEPQQWMQ